MKISKQEYNNELSSFLSFLDEEKKKCFGIQMNQENQDCMDFAPFLKHTLNNLGDPFSGKGGLLESFKYERELVRLVSEILMLNPDEAWGYYTSGSSISNLQAVHLGAKKIGGNAILVTSVDAHNSIKKAGDITRIQETVEIDTLESGEIDPEKFKTFLKNKKRNQKFIFCFCSGSVSKGAYDNVEQLVEIIKEVGIKKENRFIHLDAALGGMITPFLIDRPLRLDFSIPEVDSLSVSFHKRIGIPVPGSLFLIRKSSLNSCHSKSYIEDYESFDNTIPGSRDGLAPFITLMKLKKFGVNGMIERTNKVLERAKWFDSLLKDNGIFSIRNKYSPCIYFEAFCEKILKEYHMPIYRKENGKKFTHIFTMEHVQEQELYTFLEKSKVLTKILQS